MKIKLTKLLRAITVVTGSFALYANAQVIQMPVPDQVIIPGSETDIVLNLSEGTPGVDYTVFVNGRNVNDLGAVVGSEFIVPAAQLGNIVKNGRNTLALIGPDIDVDSPLYGEARYFFYDVGGPQVRIDNVADNGINLSVQGAALDPTGITSVSINGVNATVAADGTFSVDVANSMNYTVLAQDVDGNITQVDYTNFDEAIPESVSVRIDNSDLGIVNELIADVIDDSDLADRLIANNPLYDGPTSLGHAVLNAEDITINRPTVVSESTGTDYSVVATSPDLVVRLDGEVRSCLGWFCIPIGVNGDIIVPEVIISSNAVAEFVNDAAVVELQDFAVEIPEFEFDVDSIQNRPWYLRGWIIKNIFEGIVELVSEPILQDTFTESLEVPLEDVLSEGFSTLARIGLGLDVFGTEFDISVRPEGLFPVNGGLGLTAQVDVQTVSEETGNAGLGYRTLNTVVPGPNDLGSDYELAAALSTDLVNQIIWKVQKSGLLNLDICGQTSQLTEIDELLGLDLTPIGQDPLLTFLLAGSDFQLSSNLYDAPYLVLDQANDAKATIVIPSFEIGLDFIDIPLFNNGVANTTIIADISLDVTLYVVDGKVGIDVVGSPIVALTVTEAFLDAGNGPTPLFLDALITEIELIALSQIPAIIPSIEEAIGEIEIPNFAGLEIDLQTIDTLADGSGIFIGLATEIGPEGLDLSILTDGLGDIVIPLPPELGDLFCEAPDPVVDPT